MEDLRKILFKQSEDVNGSTKVEGYDFNKGLDYAEIFKSYYTTGFQATHLGMAIETINDMLSWRVSDEPQDESESAEEASEGAQTKTKVFLSFTSNMISCGLREQIRYLVQHKLVDVLVTSGGGIEEDFIKCLAPLILGDFNLSGTMLHERGLNRIGNLLMPNNNYCKFEQWIMPLLDNMLAKQREGYIWTPSKMIHYMGEMINNEESVYYWAYKNNIPVFCPGITDGSIGDMLFVHSMNNDNGLILDIVRDITAINSTAMSSIRSGMLILGGGLPKHHVCNANLMRNGAEYSVYINTGIEHEGSDSGAAPDEAVSWGKIRGTRHPVKVFAEATLVLPILIAESFYKYHQEHPEGCEVCCVQR